METSKNNLRNIKICSTVNCRYLSVIIIYIVTEDDPIRVESALSLYI